MLQRRAESFARGRIAQLGNPIVAARHHGLAVRAKGHGPDRALMDQGCPDRFLRGCFPQAGRAVAAARQDGFAIRAEDPSAGPRWAQGGYTTRTISQPTTRSGPRSPAETINKSC